MKARPTKEQVDARVNEILRVMLDGAQRWDFVEFVRQREQESGSPWHVAEGQQPLAYSGIRRYLQKAQKLIASTGEGDRAELLRAHVAKRRNLYAKAVSQGDIRAALSVLDSEARLLGLFPGDETKAGPNGHTVVNIFERAVILAEQLRQPRALDGPVPAGLVSGDRGGEPVDNPDAHPQAAGILASG